MYQYISIIFFIKIFILFFNTEWLNILINLIEINYIYFYASLVEDNQILVDLNQAISPLAGLQPYNLGISILLNELLNYVSYLTNTNLSIVKVYLLNSFNNGLIHIVMQNFVFGYNFNTYLLIIFYTSNLINLIKMFKELSKYPLTFIILFVSLIYIFNDLNLLNF